MTNESLTNKLTKLKNDGFFNTLVIRRGIEKEFFRVDSDGYISKSPVSYTHLTLPTKA